MYSADSVGKIFAWNCNLQQPGEADFAEWSLKQEIEMDELNVRIENGNFKH